MTKLYLLIYSLSLTFVTTAQNIQLHIILKPEKGGQIQSGTAELRLMPDSSIVNTKAIRSTASFDVKPNSQYILKVSAVGMHQSHELITIIDSSLTLTIELKSKAGNLGNVTVYQESPL